MLCLCRRAAGGTAVAAAPGASALPPSCEGIAKQYIASQTEAEAQMFYRAGQLVGCW